MAISLRENKIAGRAFLIVPAVFLTGAIYFLTAFGEWGQVGFNRSYDYWYCLPVGLMFLFLFVLSFTLAGSLFKHAKSSMMMEFRAMITALSLMAVMLWIYIYYNSVGEFYHIDFFNINIELSLERRFAVYMLWLLCLPAVYVLLLLLQGFAAQIREGVLLKSSLVYRIAYRRGRTENMRSMAWLYMLIAFDCMLSLAPVFLGMGIGLIYMIDYKLAPLMICLLVLLYFAAFMTAYYLLINGKQSMVRDADNAMRDAVERAVASEKLKVELITNVSHDLRTPMTSIVGYGEILEGMELSDEADECVRKLNHKSRYLLSMLEDVFDMSKTATGNAALNMEELNLVMLLNQTIAECDDRLEKSGRKLCVDIDSDSVLVRTDGSRIHRVFSNLLDNAVKYSLAGTRIFVTLKTYDDRVSVEIMNTSSYEMNFTPERITQRFVRGDSECTGEGSGIGLAIAKTYTEGVGGSFDIKLKGDSFSAVVTLPLES